MEVGGGRLCLHYRYDTGCSCVHRAPSFLSYSFYCYGFYFYLPYSYFSYFSAYHFCSVTLDISLCWLIHITLQNFKLIWPAVLKIWCILENIKVEAIPVEVKRVGVKGKHRLRGSEDVKTTRSVQYWINIHRGQAEQSSSVNHLNKLIIFSTAITDDCLCSLVRSNLQ